MSNVIKFNKSLNNFFQQNLKEADNGNFFDWSGKKIPW